MDAKIFRTERFTEENLKVGTVIRFPANDGSIHGFNDTVIEGIDGDVVSLARPYVTRGLGNDTLHFGVERHKVSISSMLSRAVVVYEGSVVNRVIID